MYVYMYVCMYIYIYIYIYVTFSQNANEDTIFVFKMKTYACMVSRRTGDSPHDTEPLVACTRQHVPRLPCDLHSTICVQIIILIASGAYVRNFHDHDWPALCTQGAEQILRQSYSETDSNIRVYMKVLLTPRTHP
jgi:hypothetical protein